MNNPTIFSPTIQLLIEPMFNLNIQRKCMTLVCPEIFNRTNVELKWAIVMWSSERRETFNRTNVELKYALQSNLSAMQSAFNRTNVELKFRPQDADERPRVSFNRTNVELKSRDNDATIIRTTSF